jgi:hypothetical protein
MDQVHNPKHKREVCRYWLNSRCLKGPACEFLHSIDYDKMPVCPLGSTCKNDGCNFKHPLNQAVCANYQAGFCSFGRRCAHAHILSSARPPEISEYLTDKNAAFIRSLEKATESNFRKKACDYFSAHGWCPYFDMCNFKH